MVLLLPCVGGGEEVAGFSAGVPYGPLEVQARLLCRALYWYPLFLSLTLIRLIHWLEQLPWTGVYFRFHTWSRFIVRFYCKGFNCASLAERLLGAYAASPIIGVMLGFIKAIGELSRLDLPAVGIY